MNPKLLSWVGVILAGIACVGVLIVAHGKHAADPSFGSTSAGGPVFNAGAVFPIGLQLGSQKENTSAATLSIVAGQNQASWCNAGPASVVFETWGYLAGTTTTAVTAGSYKLYVGTTTTATVSDFNTTRYAGLINGALFATSTKTNQVIADNAASHAGSVTASIAVQSGECLNAQVQSTYGCTADSALCKTATSSQRGWSTISVPFYYKQR